MWVDTRECVPLVDGEYMVQTVYGRVILMNYTYKGGWNTHYINEDGELDDDSAMSNLYVVRWHSVDTPKSVPKEWYNEYWQKEVME